MLPDSILKYSLFKTTNFYKKRIINDFRDSIETETSILQIVDNISHNNNNKALNELFIVIAVPILDLNNDDSSNQANDNNFYLIPRKIFNEKLSIMIRDNIFSD